MTGELEGVKSRETAMIRRTGRVRARIMAAGPVPPPAHGVAVMTRTLLESPLAQRFEILHVDTSDRRDVRNIGRLDAGNVWLAAVHGVRFASLLARSRPDAVYIPLSQNTLGFMRDLLFLIPAMAVRVPIVLHLHGGRYDELVRSSPPPLGWLARAVFTRARRIVILGEALRPMLEGIAPASSIDVVPNGVPDPGVGARPGRAAGTRMRILYLGNLIATKGYIDLLMAVQMLLDEGMDVEVTFAGGVADSAVHARALRDVRHGPERIRFAGSVDTAGKAALLASADVLALPSYYENEAHPLVILEAMAAGLPVVSTRHGAIPEAVADGQTGILLAPRDVMGLRAALRRLALDPSLRACLGEAGRIRYEECFTVDRWADRMTNVFSSAVAAA